MLETISLLGVNVSRVDPSKAVGKIFEWIRAKQKTYVCVAPVATLVDARRNDEYRNVVNAAGMVTPDGMPVVWLARLRGCKAIERTYGPDLMHEVCRQGQDLKLRHFFYGGTEATLQKLEQSLRGLYPEILIAGRFSPDFRSKAWQEESMVIDQINASGADIVWVGLGSPKQDFWMQLNRPLLSAPVIVGAGAAFDFISGTKPQAPQWMRQSGLEWFFRLCCEPRRLWKRYLIGNSLFLMYVLRDSLKRY